jgi:hypothetical protein
MKWPDIMKARKKKRDVALAEVAAIVRYPS